MGSSGQAIWLGAQAEMTAKLEPFGGARQMWRAMVANSPDATLYHSERWLDLLVRAYGFDLYLATAGDGEEAAGCVLARSKNPFSWRLVALPFSDSCKPLATGGAAIPKLLTFLTACREPGGIEIRGQEAAAPWQTLDCFVRWVLDLRPTAGAVEKRLNTNFRRNLRTALETGVRITRGRGAEYLRRFHALQVETRRRFGLPAQSLRFFMLAQEVFGDQLEVWLAHLNGPDFAGSILIRDRSAIHIKWSARRESAPRGANHLILRTVAEEFTGKVDTLDLGRADRRNQGLMRFKSELGAKPEAIPYAFYPRAPRQVSAETLSGPYRAAAQVMRRAPLPLAKILGAAIYRYLG